MSNGSLFYCFLQSSLDLLPPSERNVVEGLLKSIVAKAWDEWEGKEDEPYDDLGSRRIKCSLCGTDNKLVFIIQNKFNGKTFNVGSTCILEFGSNFEFGQEHKNAKQIIKERKIIERKAKVLRAIPNAKIIENWFDLKYPIVLPDVLTKGFKQCGDKLNKLYNEYLDGKRDEKIFNEINEELSKRDSFIKLFDEYVKENRDKQFVASQEISEWCKYNLDEHWNKLLREKGFINWGIACRVMEKNFRHSLIPLLNEVIKPIKMEIIGINEKAYLVKYALDEIIIECPHNHFMMNLGATLFNEVMDKPLTVELILKQAIVTNERTLVVVIDALENLLRRIKFSIYKRDYEKDEILVYNDEPPKYIEIKMSLLANRFLSYIFGINVKLENLAEHIRKFGGKQYTYNEIQNIEAAQDIVYEKKNIYRKPR